MRLLKRVTRAAGAVAARANCPGPGVVNALALDDAPDPPPCRVCGGCHLLVIEEVVVETGPEGGPAKGRVGVGT